MEPFLNLGTTVVVPLLAFLFQAEHGASAQNDNNFNRTTQMRSSKGGAEVQRLRRLCRTFFALEQCRHLMPKRSVVAGYAAPSVFRRPPS